MSADDAVNAISVKIPPFWEDDPETWFGQADAQFHLRKVVESLTKFYHVISLLPQKVAISVKDLSRNPPTKDPYETLKKRLLQSYNQTDSQRAAAIIRYPALGDCRPSQLLDALLALLPEGHAPCFFFKHLYMEKLPRELRAQLAAAEVDDYCQLGVQADRLYNLLYPDGFAAHSAAAVETETEEVQAVSNQGSNHRRPRNRQKNNRHRSNSNPHGRRAQHSYSNNDVCFYHEKFGAQARKCEEPCSYNQGNAMSGGRR